MLVSSRLINNTFYGIVKPVNANFDAPMAAEPKIQSYLVCTERSRPALRRAAAGAVIVPLFQVSGP
jgi:hypothetical protein